MTIGENMRQLREENGYSLKQVEERTGINNGNLSRYERNLNFPSIEWCIKLADLYGVTIDELIGRSDGFDNVTVQSSAPAPTEEERELLFLFGKMSHAQKVRFLAYGEGLIGAPLSTKWQA